MLENLSKKLESKLDDIQNFYSKNSSSIEDIVVYGSAVKKSEPRDIDIAILLKEKVNGKELSYKLRKLIETKNMKVDVKQKTFKDLLDPDFLAGGSIILEGYSLISEEFLANKLNLKNRTLFKYNLEKMDNNQKTRYNYALKGRGEKQGVLEDVNGEHLSKGTILIPIQRTGEFKNFLEKWDIKYNEYRVAIKPVL